MAQTGMKDMASPAHRDSMRNATVLHALERELRQAAAPQSLPHHRAPRAYQLPGLRWLRARYYRFVSSLLGSNRGRT